MHLIIYFNGTQDDGSSFGEGTSPYINNPNVKTIVVQGCHHQEVCNAGVFPNLAKFAKRFTSTLFKKRGKDLTLNVSDLRSLNIGIDVDSERGSGDLTNLDTGEKITGITLCGYSRGAVTCFNVAKELNKIAPDLPVDIVANQPVPGNSYQLPGSNAASIADCSKLTNLRNVSIILGAYTGDDINAAGRSRIHRGFFSQIIPRLPRSKKVKRDLIVIPKQHHNVGRMKVKDGIISLPSGEQQLHMQLAKYLHETDSTYVDEVSVNEQIQAVTDSYLTATRRTPVMNDEGKVVYQPNIIQMPAKAITMPRAESLQSFFGLKRREVYQHIDKSNPLRLLRSGMQLMKDESLMEWWRYYDASASRFSTPLTKALVNKIDETKDINNVEKMLTLYEEADKWLILKDGSSSSRYYQVTALRDNIHHLLITQSEDKQQELTARINAINYKNMHENNYFLKHWTNLSGGASYFKTEATRVLDRAFKKHSQNKRPSEENDRELLKALDTWLTDKEGSNSKRYELVVQMHEQLSEVIEKAYPKSEEGRGRKTEIYCSSWPAIMTEFKINQLNFNLSISKIF